MTQTELNAVIETRLAASAGLLVEKGKEYCHSDSDRLDSFKDQARAYGVTALVVWGIFFDKHIRAIQAYVKSGVEASEPIEGRIDDAINYLLLGAALILEQKEIARQLETIKSNQAQLEASSQAFQERAKRGRPLGSKNKQVAERIENERIAAVQRVCPCRPGFNECCDICTGAITRPAELRADGQVFEVTQEVVDCSSEAHGFDALVGPWQPRTDF